MEVSAKTGKIIQLNWNRKILQRNCENLKQKKNHLTQFDWEKNFFKSWEDT